MSKRKSILTAFTLCLFGGIASVQAAPFGITISTGVSTDTGNVGEVINEQNNPLVTSAESTSRGILTVFDGLTNVSTPFDVSAFGSANLSTGEVKISGIGACGGGVNTNCSSLAGFNDRLTFDLSGLSALEFITIDLSVSVDGTLGAGSQTNINFGATDGRSQSWNGAVGYNGISESTTIASLERFANNGQFGNFTQFGPDLFVGTLDLFGGDIVDLDIFLNVSSSGEFDLSNTGSFNIAAPVPFTSASGVFLTQTGATGDVPEPGTLALFGIGVFGMVLVRRRRISS